MSVWLDPSSEICTQESSSWDWSRWNSKENQRDPCSRIKIAANLWLSGAYVWSCFPRPERLEMSVFDKDLKETYLRIKKLLPNTPRAVVLFLGGNLPGTAVIHSRMLSLFGMVARFAQWPAVYPCAEHLNGHQVVFITPNLHPGKCAK